MKKIFLLTLTLALAVFAVACSAPTQGQTSDGIEIDKPLTIGILQLTEHLALDDAREGFIKALEDNGFIDKQNIEIDFQNAQNDPSNLLTMSQRFVNSKHDLVLAIATGAAQSIASQTSDIPILFTAVTDPVVTGLVEDNKKPNTNLSGTIDLSPIEEQIDLLLTLAPDTKNVGVLYNAGEDNSVLQVEILKEILQQKGLNLVEQTVANSNDVQQATQSIISKCDAIYIPADNTLASAMPIVADITQKAKMPVICAEENPVKKGGLATIGINYFNLGYQTGEMAVKVLNGEDISLMPVESLNKFDYFINAETARIIGIEIPDELKEFMQ